jgi:hypothetical protein
MPIDVYAAMGALVRAEAAHRSTVPAQSDASAPPAEPPEAVPVSTPRTAGPGRGAAPPRTAVPSPAAAPTPVPPRRTAFLRALRTAWRDVWGMCR